MMVNCSNLDLALVNGQKNYISIVMGSTLGRLDPVILVTQKSNRSFQIMLAFDINKWKKCMCGKVQNADKQTIGDAHGKNPVFDVSDSLLLSMNGKQVHCQFLQSCCVLIITMLARNCSLGVYPDDFSHVAYCIWFVTVALVRYYGKRSVQHYD